MSARFRGPPTAVVVIVTAVLQVAGTVFAARHQPAARPLDALAFVLLLLGPALLVLRRLRPGPMIAAIAAVDLAYLLLGYAWGPFLISLAAGLILAGIAGARRWVWATTAVLALSVLALGLAQTARIDPARAAGGIAWLVVFVLVGEGLRVRAERFAERRRAAAEARQRRENEERLALARDIHDVVAHSLSTIHVRASVALHLAKTDPGELEPALQAIKDVSKDALEEIRQVLGVLRQEAPTAPQLRLDRLPELAAQLRAGGLDVRLENTLAVPLDSELEAALYRVVQEGLTNVARHSGATRCQVSLSASRGRISVRITDNGHGMAGRGFGHGLTGMRERLAGFGGTLRLHDGGAGLTLLATVPLQPAALQPVPEAPDRQVPDPDGPRR